MTTSSNNFPFEIKDLDPEEADGIHKHFFKGYQNGFLRVGPKGYFFTNGIKVDIKNTYNMPIRPDDTFVVTFPKSGTTWTQELVWMVANNLDYEKSDSIPLHERFPFLDMFMVINSDITKNYMKDFVKGDERLLKIIEKVTTPGTENAAKLSSPRFIKTHMPFSLLPPKLLDTAKVVYVARDPRDAVVSYYHHNKLFEFMDYNGDFKQYWEYFIQDKNMVDGLVRVGPKGYFFNSGMKKDAAPIYNMPITSDDVFVVTFPKSGTTWVQELVWLIGNNFDYETAAAIPLIKRSPFLEHSSFCNGENTLKVLLKILKGDEKKIQFLKELLKPSYKMVEALPSPRFVKSHLPLSLLPPGLLRARVVYVARDPRDVAVSYYHHALLFKNYCFTGDFKNFWDYFRKDMLDWTPYFEHIKEAWDKRNHPNMLFLFYEELLEDLAGAVRRVAHFLGAPVSEEQVVHLCNHLSFHNFKNNKSVNFDVMREMGLMSEDGHFVRKGKAGGWREHFDEQMAAQAQQWIDDNLRGTDLRFPSGKK